MVIHMAYMPIVAVTCINAKYLVYVLSISIYLL